jgi:hypothetical protein
MTDNEGRRHQTMVRMRGFFVQRAPDFAEGSIARQMIDDLAAAVMDLEGAAADQQASVGQVQQHTTTKGDARRAVREDLEAINRVARLIGREDLFPLPPRENDELLMNAARGFAGNAFPLTAQFIAHEMPANFLEDLSADISAFDAAVAAQGDAIGDRVAAGSLVSDQIDRGMELRRKLDILVKTKFANDPTVLAEWASASHIERAPRRAAAAGSTSPGGSSPPTGSPSTPSSGGGTGGTSGSGGTPPAA